MTQAEKAKRFRELHHDKKLLVLPNVWDAVGARMLAHMGFPAVATASAAVAFSLGYDDGQRITFDAMLDAIGRVAAAVDVPVSADIEQGYATELAALAANVGRVIDAGAVGVNIEDSIVEGGELRGIADQCDRLRAVRQTADDLGVPIVINARTDVFLSGGDTAGCVDAVVERGRAYLDAGADCVYPIGPGDLETIKPIVDGLGGAPVNVYVSARAASMRELEAAGVARISLGPALLRTSLTAMRRVAQDLLAYNAYDSFTQDILSSDEIRKFLKDGAMKHKDSE